jgi:hypothetical protein
MKYTPRQRNRPRADEGRVPFNTTLSAPDLTRLRAVAAARNVRPTHLVADIVSAWLTENVQ